MTVWGHHLDDRRLRLFVAEHALLVSVTVALWTWGAASPPSVSRGLLLATSAVLALQWLTHLLGGYEARGALSAPRVGTLVSLALGGLLWWATGGVGPALGMAVAAGAISAGLRRVQLQSPVPVVWIGPPELLRALESECGTDEGLTRVWAGPGDAAARPLMEAALARHPGAWIVVDPRQVRGTDVLAWRLRGHRVCEPWQFVARRARRLPPVFWEASTFVSSGEPPPHPWVDGACRGLDLLGALVLSVVLGPPLLVGMLLVRLGDRGPIFYSQWRTGRGGVPFRIWKLRTMRVDAEASGARWAQNGDPRVTPMGRFLRRSRLDEIPQLWCVLRGHMSLVGPRPERPEFDTQIAAQVPGWAWRWQVRPGITGWAQIHHPYGASIDDAREKLSYDLYHVLHRSPLLYLIVLFQTVRTVLLAQGGR